MKNCLHIKSMEHNLVPPFIMREAGLAVNEKAKIHAEAPTNTDHSIFDEDTGLRIPLLLKEVFSYFETRRLTKDEMINCASYDVIYLSPDSVNGTRITLLGQRRKMICSIVKAR